MGLKKFLAIGTTALSLTSCANHSPLEEIGGFMKQKGALVDNGEKRIEYCLEIGKTRGKMDYLLTYVENNGQKGVAVFNVENSDPDSIGNEYQNVYLQKKIPVLMWTDLNNDGKSEVAHSQDISDEEAKKLAEGIHNTVHGKSAFNMITGKIGK